MVHFGGAGPGAPDLITVRGADLLREADCVIYAGSLVNPALLERTKPGCEIHNSAVMTLEQVIEVMRKADSEQKDVVRLHTGDASRCGAIREPMDELDRLGIAYDSTPGVSQSLIISRMAGRTPVPPGESLSSLAAHGASMVLFLSSGLLHEVQDELLRGGLSPETPAAIVYKATWPDERVIRCTVGTLAQRGEEEGIRKTALLLIGQFLDPRYERSCLYDPSFTTEFRQAEQPKP